LRTIPTTNFVFTVFTDFTDFGEGSYIRELSGLDLIGDSRFRSFDSDLLGVPSSKILSTKRRAAGDGDFGSSSTGD
jgi:hypothetical protein